MKVITMEVKIMMRMATKVVTMAMVTVMTVRVIRQERRLRNPGREKKNQKFVLVTFLSSRLIRISLFIFIFIIFFLSYFPLSEKIY